jgi:hypothetical protein
MNYGGVQKQTPDALLGGILCLFIGTRAWFTMHDSWAYLYHIFRLGFSLKAHETTCIGMLTCP